MIRGEYLSTRLSDLDIKLGRFGSDRLPRGRGGAGGGGGGRRAMSGAVERAMRNAGGGGMGTGHWWRGGRAARKGRAGVGCDFLPVSSALV